MAERTARTEIINLGNELITGKKSDNRGRLIEPTAEVIPISNNIKLTLDGDVGAINFSVNAKYQEATQEEDVAYFLLEVFDADTNNLIGEYKKSTKDVPVQYNEYVFPLHVDFDVEKFRDKTIKLRAHLKCWLETSGWTPRGGGEESVSDEDFVNITLEVPEITAPKQNPIVHFNVIGRALRKGEKEEDYARQDNGKEYRVITTITNSTANKITYGELDFYENNNLLSDLSRGIKEIQIGHVYPVTLKFTKSWDWYKTEKDGKLTITDVAERQFVYKLDYYLKDKYGYDWEDVIDKPLSSVKIVISVSNYRVDSVKVYNDSFDAEYWADIASLVLEVDIILASAGVGYLIEKVFGTLIGAAAGAGADLLGLRIGDNIAKLATGKTVKEWAQELRIKLKEIINDPPKFDRHYRQVAPTKRFKLKRLYFKNKREKLWYALIKSHSLIIPTIDAALTASNRAWSAELKKDKLAAKKQKKAFNKSKENLEKNLQALSRHVAALAGVWTKLKVNKAEFIALKQVIRRDGLPTTIKLQMKKKGFSDKKLKRLESAILMQSANKLDAASAYRNYSKSLQKLAASLKEWII